MSQDNFDPEAEWTSESLGWVLTFQTDPDGLDDLPAGSGPKTKGDALAQHFKECFEKLDNMIGDGVRIVTRMKSIGCACILGNQEACERLKDKVESDSFALMCKNTRCVRVID